MKPSKFSAEQMVQILEECKNSRAVDVARKHNISDKTISNWKKKFKGMVTDDVRRMRHLEEENSKLKRIVANLTLDNLGYKEILSKKW